ncbi:MAG: DJ-1/PfpI family protein [Clostridia bacterium]|nr:DJ-1/PfpI family protein [Clostridia bacterium]
MIYMFLADGFEETEAIATADVLIRAGLEFKTVGVGDKTVTGSHGIKIESDLCDCRVSTDDDISAVILPGGMPGTTNLKNSEVVISFLNFAVQNNILICAICAAPSILGSMGLLNGKKAVCYPGFEGELKGAILQEEAVCKDGNFITAKGAGAAIDFGLEIVKALDSEEKSIYIRESMQCI